MNCKLIERSIEMDIKKLAAAAVCAVTAANSVILPACAETAETEADPLNIVINGGNANTLENMLYRGVGMVSGNNSSRLLLDYKAENPDAYWEIMNYIFGKNGLEVAHLKLEMGSDINSSSGTEPSVMRSADETADVTRGAGYQLAADAKTINPDLTLDMLWWSEPRWISDSDDVYAARYKWYKNTLDAAYDTYGIKFDYVSATQNERGRDNGWIVYLSQHLKSEPDSRYDYSAIKIVAGEEVCTWQAAAEVLKGLRDGDATLSDNIDVLGSHYTSSSTDHAQELAREYGKELWFSEGSSPMAYSEGAWRFDEGNSGLTGINGALDIANRYISMYPQGGMTLCQFQPVVAAYYDGVCYCQKQFINACDPWSGYYTLDSGFYTMLQFTQFMDKGWSFVDGACYADGVPGGDGHAMVDEKYSYMTTCSPDKSDYSTVITNTTAEPLTYEFEVSELANAGSEVHLWETRGPDGGAYNENYFKNIGSVTPEENGGKYTYTVTVKPYSILTVSTIDLPETEYKNPERSERTILELPYSDDFSYAGYGDDFLASRGNAPRYTTDEGGAFEVNDGVLVQQITAAEKANEWGWTPDPTTNFGDDRWYNYSVSAKVIFADSDNAAGNYTGVGLRYIQGHAGASGYWLKLTQSGDWSLWENSDILRSGKSTADTSAPVELKIEAVDNNVKCWINGEQVCDYTAEGSFLGAGRAAFFSSYDRNGFDDLVIAPAEVAETYITRFDNTDLMFDYTGEWNHNTMSSFKNYKRTMSSAKAGCSFAVDFTGTGIAITGGGKDASVTYTLDGGEEVAYTVPSTGMREVNFMLKGLENGEHHLNVTVTDGTYNVDGAEVTGMEVYTAAQREHSAEQEPSGVTGEAQSAEQAGQTTGEQSGAEQGDSENKGGFPAAAGIGIGAAVVAAGAAAAVIVRKKKK